MKRYYQLVAIISICLLSACNGGHNSGKTPETPRDRPQAYELKVVKLPTIDGRTDDSTEAESYTYPPAVKMDSIDLHNIALIMYGTAYDVWAGPNGWTGRGEYAPDATVRVTLYPAGGNADDGPRIEYEEMSSCQGCILREAAQYFPDAMMAYNAAFNEDHKNDISISSNVMLERISDQIVHYAYYPSGGMVAQGIMYYIPSGDDGDAYLKTVKLVLPEKDKATAQAVIAVFLRQTGSHHTATSK